MLTIYITIVLLFIYASLIIYYRQSWLAIPPFDVKQSKISQPQTLISVIIPARNEENNIAACLQSIINQSYPENLFEMIVVDDFSTDNTQKIVSLFSAKNVTIIFLKDFAEEGKLNSYKKKAIEIGISKAKGDLIVTTDADCIVPKHWLQTISSFYESHQPVFIAAPVAYFPTSSADNPGQKFLKIFQSLDFMTLQGITGASVYKKFHSMCNGANLAYEKKIFYEVGGFAGIDAIASGDDMLLMHKIFSRYPTKVLFLKSVDAIVQTPAAQTVKEFFNQRIRWASKADKYSDKKITGVLLLVYFFNCCILLAAFLAFIQPKFFIWLGGILITKTVVELFFLYPVATFFNKQKMLWWFPLAQPFHIIYTVLAGFLGKFGSYTWKERKVK